MIEQLNVHHLRNLNLLSIQTTRCNVFIGDNGSGKTSVLEAIYLLSRGKSFRHYQPKRYISHQYPHVTVFAKFDDSSSMGIQKSIDAATMMRIDTQSVYAQSLLTKRLPTLLIDPTSMDILEIGSSSRRQLLDWIVFHVKPEFHMQWLAYQRLLKQRNSLLRNNIQLSTAQRQELAAWDRGLANHADLVTHYRQQVFTAWQPVFSQLLQQLLPKYAPQIHLKFSAGYDTSMPLDKLLLDRIDQDCHMGYTRIGCHRSDVHILWEEESQSETESLNSKHGNSIKDQAANVLSRGEKKLLITALKLSQLSLLYDQSQPLDKNLTSQINSKVDSNKDNEYVFESIATPPVVLLDDIAAELDAKALSLLLQSLANIPCQVFITNLDDSIKETLSEYWGEYQLFHMKHGEVDYVEQVTSSTN